MSAFLSAGLFIALLGASEFGEARCGQLHLEQAIEHLKNGETEQGLPEARRARELCDPTEDPEGTLETLIVLGMLATREKNQEEAYQAYDEALRLSHEVGDDLGQLMALVGRGDSRRISKQFDAALDDYEKALDLVRAPEDSFKTVSLATFRIFSAIQGAPPELITISEEYFAIARPILLPILEAMILRQIALVYRDQKDNEKALAVLDRSLELSLAFADLRSSILMDMGTNQSALRRWDEAIDDLERAYATACKSTDQTLRLKILNKVADVESGRGRMGAALSAHRRLYRLARELENRKWQSAALYNSGQLLSQSGLYEKAIPYLEKSMEIDREIDDRDFSIPTLNTLAMAYQSAGREEEARSLLHQALDLAESSENKDLIGNVRNTLGDFQRSQGLYDDAQRTFEEALAMARASGNAELEAAVLNNLSYTLLLQARYQEALVLLRQSMDLGRDLGDLQVETATRFNIAVAYSNLGLLTEAMVYLRESLAIARETVNIGGESMAYLGLGALYLQAGEVGDARLYLTKAQELSRQVGDPALEILATLIMSQTLNNTEDSLDSLRATVIRAREEGFREVEMIGQMFLALQYLKLRRSEEATGALTAVLEVAEAGGLRVLQSTGITGLAGVSILSGRMQEAISALESSSTLLDSVQDDVVSDDHLVASSELPSAIYTLLVYVLAEQGSPERAFDYSEKARSIAFLRRIGHPRVQPRSVPADLLSKEETLLRRIHILSRQLEIETMHPREEGSGHSDRLQKSLSSSRDEYSLLRLEIKERYPEYAAFVSTGTVGHAEIQAALPPDVSLISYFTGFQPGSAALAWVVDRSELHMVSLKVTNARLQRQARHLNDVIRGRGFDFEAAAELYRELIAPLEPFIRHRNIILVPHGALHELPFAALWSAERGRFLIEDYALIHAPSANALRFLAGKQSPNLGHVLVMGDPDGSLPRAREEAEAIARLFGQRAWVGSTATESRIRTRGTEIDVIHLAAHAHYDPRNLLFSHLSLAPDEENDGKLELREVFQLDLTGTNLVVLSGCDTALGERTSADDLTGMTRAFLFAGSPAVITSLWYVDDASSAALMKSFYQNLMSSSSTAEALRQAQLEISNREQWRSPYYWAAFVLTGDAAWSPPGERSP